MARIVRPSARVVLGRLVLLTATVISATVAACGGVEPGEEPGAEPRGDEVATRRDALGGIEGTLEYALDAPWRMEPYTVFKGKGYAPIPLHMTINDADRITDDVSAFDASPKIGRVCQLDVTENGVTTTIPVASFAEIERTIGAWTYPGTEQPNGPPRESCTATTTSNCTALRSVHGTSEWHALALYSAQGAKPGATVPLTLELRVSRDPAYDCTSPDPKTYYRFRNHVRVHYGEEALPKFSNAWAYGDLHYHSQGTDNEGESGYNYRGVSRAMQALGLDFLWATEHASASNQIVDADLTLNINVIAASQIEARVKRGVLRDMDARRFRKMNEIVKDTNRRTALRAGVLSKGVVPRPAQIFLGGELDVIPETSQKSPQMSYGANKTYTFTNLCGGWHRNAMQASSDCDSGVFRCADTSVILGALEDDISSCDPGALWVEAGGGGWLLRDVQSLNEFDFGREHMVYLPDPGETDPFIASETGTYGGGGRRLVEDRVTPNHTYKGVLPEVEQKRGSVFLAHHLNAPSGGEGPEGPPWTPTMLDKAWRSPAVLGLEFWNEDGRRASRINENLANKELGYERDDTELFGQVELHLVDKTRKALKSNSDGLFELIPFDLSTGRYEKATRGVESMLADGAVSWDRLNMKGLDPSKTSELPWLPAGQPRRMFVAGGSDAHGDFNYRREGYMEGTSGVIDMALGTPRNLVLTGAPSESVDAMGAPVYGANQVLTALRAGRFSVTDGPAMRIVVDSNNNGVIDDTDAQMGDVLDVFGRTQIPILVEWNSTPEFGALARIELTVGALDAASLKGRLYSGGWGTGTPGSIDSQYDSADGLVRYSHSNLDYWFLSSPQPPIDTPQGERLNMLSAVFPEYNDPAPYMKGVRKFVLDLSQLPVSADGTRANRLFVRALGIGRTSGGSIEECQTSIAAGGLGLCIRRYALTNPIWVRNSTLKEIDVPFGVTK